MIVTLNSVTYLTKVPFMFPRDDKVLNGFLLEVMMVVERAKAQYLTYF